MHGHSGMTINPRIPTMPERSTLDFDRPDRQIYHLHHLQIDDQQIDHLQVLTSRHEMLCRTCTVQIQPRKPALNQAQFRARRKKYHCKYQGGLSAKKKSTVDHHVEIDDQSKLCETVSHSAPPRCATNKQALFLQLLPTEQSSNLNIGSAGGGHRNGWRWQAV